MRSGHHRSLYRRAKMLNGLLTYVKVFAHYSLQIRVLTSGAFGVLIKCYSNEMLIIIADAAQFI